jgi:signal peptidase I
MDKKSSLRPLRQHSTLHRGEGNVWEIIKFAILALVIVIPIRLYIAQPFIVSGDSMVPTFHDKEYLIVDEISYHLGTPNRGDVVIFKYPNDPSRYFIKRIIGLPGETVTVKNDVITVINADHPSGIPIKEPYIVEETFGDTTVVLDNEEYFVLGDNRGASSDSRMWGALPEDNIVGRAFVRLFPVRAFAFHPGQGIPEFKTVQTQKED